MSIYVELWAHLHKTQMAATECSMPCKRTVDIVHRYHCYYDTNARPQSVLREKERSSVHNKPGIAGLISEKNTINQISLKKLRIARTPRSPLDPHTTGMMYNYYYYLHR